MSCDSYGELIRKADGGDTECLVYLICENTGVLGDESNEHLNVMATGNRVRYISGDSSMSEYNNPVMRIVKESDRYSIHSIRAMSGSGKGPGQRAGMIIEVDEDE